jgi:hypothetical protein
MIAKTVRGNTDLAHLFSLGQDWGIVGSGSRDFYLRWLKGSAATIIRKGVNSLSDTF